MTASEKQFIANRQNAQKSTGPKTEQGKAFACRNSIKHGLYAGDIVINASRFKEDSAEYDLLLSSLIEELKPESVFQEYLVRKIANCLWRYRRVIGAETAQINRQINDIDSDMYFSSLLKGMDKDSPQPDFSENPDSENGVADFAPQPETESKEAQSLSNLIGIRSIPSESFSLNILRYEMRLDRQLTRSFKLLKYLQLTGQTKLPPNRHRKIKK